MLLKVYLYLRRIFGLYKVVEIEGFSFTQKEIEELLLDVKEGKRIVFVYETMETELVYLRGEIRYLTRVDFGHYDIPARIYSHITYLSNRLRFARLDSMGRHNPSQPAFYIRRWVSMEVY